MKKISLFFMVSLLLMVTQMNVFADTLNNPSAWAKEDIDRMINMELIDKSMQSDYTDEITREDFCRLSINIIAKVKDESVSDVLKENAGISPFHDTNNDYVIASYNLGVINGFENNIFKPKDKISREQAAVLLHNIAKYFNINENSQKPSYADSDKISLWAEESISFLTSNKVMSGAGDNMFLPKETLKKEEAYVSMLRLYNYIINNYKASSDTEVKSENTEKVQESAISDDEEIYFRIVPVESINVGDKIKMQVDTNLKEFKLYRVKWSTGDNLTATIDYSGNVTALRNGTAKIVVKAHNNRASYTDEYFLKVK